LRLLLAATAVTLHAILLLAFVVMSVDRPSGDGGPVGSKMLVCVQKSVGDLEDEEGCHGDRISLFLS
jgi:hypothetical protein